jgi:hypothetical protein
MHLATLAGARPRRSGPERENDDRFRTCFRFSLPLRASTKRARETNSCPRTNNPSVPLVFTWDNDDPSGTPEAHPPRPLLRLRLVGRRDPPLCRKAVPPKVPQPEDLARRGGGLQGASASENTACPVTAAQTSARPFGRATQTILTLTQRAVDNHRLPPCAF